MQRKVKAEKRTILIYEDSWRESEKTGSMQLIALILFAGKNGYYILPTGNVSVGLSDYSFSDGFHDIGWWALG